MIQHLAGFVLRGLHRLIEVGIAGITLASVDEFEPIARAGGAPFGSHLPPAGDLSDNLGAAVEFAAPDLDVVHCLHHEYVGDVNLFPESVSSTVLIFISCLSFALTRFILRGIGVDAL